MSERPEDDWYVLNPDPETVPELGDLATWPSIPELRRARERFNARFDGKELGRG